MVESLDSEGGSTGGATEVDGYDIADGVTILTGKEVVTIKPSHFWAGPPFGDVDKGMEAMRVVCLTYRGRNSEK